MRRIVILGLPGSGKSTLARRLGAARGLPVFHLDQAYWQAGWVAAEPEAFRAEVERIAALPAWVIEGNCHDTIEPRLRAADTLVYLDMPPWRTVRRILKRAATSHGRVRDIWRPDFPSCSILRFCALPEHGTGSGVREASRSSRAFGGVGSS